MAERNGLPEEHPQHGDEAPRSGVFGVVFGLTVAGAVLGGALAMAWPKTYVATSEVAISPAVMQPLDPATVLSGGGGQYLLDDRLRMLRSATMLNAAVDRLNLSADAEFNGSNTGFSGLVSDVAELFTGDGANATDQRRRETVAALDRAVEARRIPNSSVVSISARTSDPAKSALIANTLSELLLAELGGTSPAAAARLEELHGALADAERAVFTFQNERGLLASEQELAMLDEKLAEANTRVRTLDVQVTAASSGGLDMIATGSVSSDGGPSALQDLRIRHADLRQRVASLSGKLGPRHPDLISAQAELDAAQREMESMARRASAELREELERALREQQTLTARVEHLKTQDAEKEADVSGLRELERAVDFHRTAYDEALRASTRPAALQGARVIAPAEPPLQSLAPEAATLSLAGALGGLLAGLGFAGWRRTAETDEPVEDDAAWEYDDHRDAQRDGERYAPLEPGYEAQETDEMYPYQPYGQPMTAGQAQGYPEQPPAPVGHGAFPGWYPAAPAHDPWANMRAFTPPPQHYAPAYPQQPVHTVVYVPVPAPHQAYAPPMQRAQTLDRDPFVDRRTDAAIEEIRQSLRALREAIEDFADDRYGT